MSYFISLNNAQAFILHILILFFCISGQVDKQKNHTDEFGITDSLCSYEDVLITTAYSLDTGLGFINGM